VISHPDAKIGVYVKTASSGYIQKFCGLFGVINSIVTDNLIDVKILGPRESEFIDQILRFDRYQSGINVYKKKPLKIKDLL
jgi:hypothetical protein